jgi:hypothetical protein
MLALGTCWEPDFASMAPQAALAAVRVVRFNIHSKNPPALSVRRSVKAKRRPASYGVGSPGGATDG